MHSKASITIGKFCIESSKSEIKTLKAILDKLRVAHIIDDISFHDTTLALNRMKELHKTNVWKVEKDGSLSLKNRFGHNGRFAYRQLHMMSIHEFNLVNLSILDRAQSDFLSDLLFRYSQKFDAETPKVKHKDSSSD